MNASDDAGDVLAPPLSLREVGGAGIELVVGVVERGFGVSDVVERDAIDIVVLDNLLADAGDVVGSFRLAWNHEHLTSFDSLHQFGMLPDEGRGAVAVLPLLGADGDADDPRMQLHAALVALVDAERQRVVAGRLPRNARQTHLPRLNLRGVEQGSTYAGLEDDGVDVGALVVVENADEFLLLTLTAGGVGGPDARPVESPDGGEPDRTGLAQGMFFFVEIFGSGGCVVLCPKICSQDAQKRPQKKCFMSICHY